jgi:peptidyl-prolyl isomerase G (cyclophilin G)
MFFFLVEFNSLNICVTFFSPFLCPAELKSPSLVEKDAPTIHHRKEEAGMPASNEKTVKENGERHSNGTGAAYRSDRSEERQPDVMDVHLGKSRSTSLSCHTLVIYSAYHFFHL